MYECDTLKPLRESLTRTSTQKVREGIVHQDSLFNERGID